MSFKSLVLKIRPNMICKEIDVAGERGRVYAIFKSANHWTLYLRSARDAGKTVPQRHRPVVTSSSPNSAWVKAWDVLEKQEGKG